MLSWFRSWIRRGKASRSWYLELASREGLDSKRVLSALAAEISSQYGDKGEAVYMGKRLDSLNQPLLRVKDVAVLLNVSEGTVCRYARDKVFTTFDIPGGAIRFDPRTLLEELNTYRRDSKYQA